MTPAEILSQIISLIREGRTIEAIKFLREKSGFTLLESKNLVEVLMAEIKYKKV